MSSFPPRYYALIPAAGVGARMGAAVPKQYMQLAGEPMLRHTLKPFIASELIVGTVVVASADDGFIDDVAPAGIRVLRCGGATRMESIRNGLDALADTLGDEDWVLVHDAARPGLTTALIARLIREVGDHPTGGLLALPVVDTVKRSSGPDDVETVAREGLWLAQTPQMFRFGLLRAALAAAHDPSAVTDDASAIEALGHAPKLVAGHPCNLKVTLPADVRIAEMYLAAPNLN